MKNNNENIPVSSIFIRVSDGYNFISIFFLNFKLSLNQLTSALLCTLIRNQSPVDIFIGTVNLVGRLSPKLNVNLTWNGICKNLVGSFKCECPFTYWGDKCQYNSVGFNVGSYMKFSSLSSSTNDNTSSQ
jgi:hypothetical protein